MAINKKLLRRVKKAILAEPTHFRMDTWSCGTAHCVAGWALKLSGVSIVNPTAMVWQQVTSNAQHPGEEAAELLGLDDHQHNLLFGESWWPTDLRERYRDRKTLAAKARVAAERIDRFIATDGRE